MCIVAVCDLFPEFQVSAVVLRQQLISKPKDYAVYKDLFCVVSEGTWLSTGTTEIECVSVSGSWFTAIARNTDNKQCVTSLCQEVLLESTCRYLRHQNFLATFTRTAFWPLKAACSGHVQEVEQWYVLDIHLPS